MTTPNLGLTEWEESQSQPYVTVNTALRVIDCLVQLRILDRDLTEPPADPEEGDCYIPAATATGDWEGHEDDVAMYIGGAWVFRTPLVGWKAYVVDEDSDVRYYGGSIGWDVISASS